MPPPNGAPHGYLQLTDASNDQSGAVLYNQALPANEGLNVTFDQWQYGSTTPNTPADGISFFLVNGDTALTQPGAFGGSLGYAQKLPNDDPNATFLPGVDRGYLGVGLDVLGNYFGDWEHRGNGCPNRSPAGTAFHVPAPGPNMVTVRGPGDGFEGYCFLTATTSNFTTTGPWPSTLPGKLQGPLTTLPPGVTPAEAETALEPSRRRVHIELTPAPNPVLTVSIDFNDGTGSHQVLSTPAPTPVPPTYKFGFAGSTGSFTDVHLIRNVDVTSDQPLPELNLVKQVRQPLPGDLVAGTQVPYDFVVTNSGTTDITDLAVNDPKIGPVSCPTTTLASGHTVTCTATYTVTAADVRHGSIDNTATATGNSNGTPVTSPPSSESVPIERPPGLEVEKKATTPGPYAVGQTVEFAYTVTNTGGTELTNVHVNDDHVHNITCDSTTLTPAETPGDTTTCRGTYTITANDGTVGHVTNIATATGTSNGQEITSPETEQTLEVGAPHISLTKQATSPGPFTVGSTVDYTYSVTNTGTLPLHDVLVSDDRVADITCDATTLAPGATTTCHGIYTVTQADLDNCNNTIPCTVTNVATAAGTDPQGNQIASEPSDATITVTPAPTPQISLKKEVTSQGPFTVGSTVDYTYTVTNTGNTPLRDVTVTDDRVTNVTCETTTLGPGASATCHGTYTVTEADATAGHVTNTATASGTDPQGQTVTSEPSQVTITVQPAPAPHITVKKEVTSQGPFTVGSTVDYTYTVTNTGNTPLRDVTVTDDHVTNVTCETTTLGPGTSTTCHGTYTVTPEDGTVGHVTNTATASGTDPQGQTVTSEPSQVTITVTPAPAPHITVKKEVTSQGPFTVGSTVDYTYTVTNTGNTPLHDVTANDDRVTNVTCEATTLEPGASTTCHGTYTVTEADATAGHVTNTATASGTDPQGQTVTSEPSQVTITVTPATAAHITLKKEVTSRGPFTVGSTVEYTYTVTNTGNTPLHDVTVRDDLVSHVTCEATTLEPGASTTCHGTFTITQADIDKCKMPQGGEDHGKTCTITNVAVATGIDPQGQKVTSEPARATITVKVEKRPCPPDGGHKPCRPKPPGHRPPGGHKPPHGNRPPCGHMPPGGHLPLGGNRPPCGEMPPGGPMVTGHGSDARIAPEMR
ncbi:hypothetical protein [Streptomyces sp. NPDC093097]|uniref:DUF7507 domain-containing protein n=1 Tax=Streptomyces sp. NPDC093097 TaxID=3366027 RepID=UPI00381B123C